MGGGNGELTKLFTSGELVVCDINYKKLKEARKKGFKTIECDLNKKLSFKDNSVEAFVLSQTIEHIVNVDLLLSEIHRSLKPKGKLYVSTPNFTALHNRILFLFGKIPNCYSVSDVFSVGSIKRSMSPRHIRLFTFDSMKKLFYLYGFKAEVMKGFGFYPKNLRFISKILPQFSIYIIAKFEKTRKPSLTEMENFMNTDSKIIKGKIENIIDKNSPLWR